jgi:nicotinamidase-related amidase
MMNEKKTIIPPVAFRDMTEFKRRMNALLAVDPRRTVVLTVDMQRKYLDMEIGSDPVAPDESERVLKHSKELLDFARGEGLPVIHVNVNRLPAELEHGMLGSAFGTLGRKNDLSQSAQASVSRVPDRLLGSSQAEVPATLVAPEDTHVLSKKVMDSFFCTELEVLLQKVFRADAVVVTGINTDTCVYATTFATSVRGYKPIVISDCVASMRGKEHHWMALELMSRSIAWVLTVEQFKEKIRAAKIGN